MLDPEQEDVLREVMGMGMGQAASVLSELVGSAVTLRIPELRVLEAADVGAFLDRETATPGVFISQSFSGQLEGRAVLLYSEACALALLEAVGAEIPGHARLSEASMGTLQEVGNIILGACLSSIADLISTRLALAVSETAREASRNYFARLLAGFSGGARVVIARSTLALREHTVEGHLFVILGIQDFEQLIARTRRDWGRVPDAGNRDE